MKIRLAEQARRALAISDQFATLQRRKKVGVDEAFFGILTVVSNQSTYYESATQGVNFHDIYSSYFELVGLPAYNEIRGNRERSPLLQHIIRLAMVHAKRHDREMLYVEDLLLMVLKHGKGALTGHLLKQSGFDEELQRRIIIYCDHFQPVTRHAPSVPHRRKHGKRKHHRQPRSART